MSNVVVNQSPTHSTITFGHPSGNALSSGALQSLVAAIETCADHPGNVIVIRSEGDRTFCAGASFDELMAIDSESAGLAFFSGFGHVINAIRKSPKIVVTRVQGKAVGGGVGLIAASDFSIASNYASIRLSELAVGIGPFVIGPAVERKIGTAAFAKMALTPEEWQTAHWAKERNLFQEVFDNILQVDQYLEHLIDKWSSYHPAALTEIKRMLWRGTDDWDQLLISNAAISGRLVLSDFTRHAIAQFRKA